MIYFKYVNDTEALIEKIDDLSLTIDRLTETLIKQNQMLELHAKMLENHSKIIMHNAENLDSQPKIMENLIDATKIRDERINELETRIDNIISEHIRSIHPKLPKLPYRKI